MDVWGDVQMYGAIHTYGRMYGEYKHIGGIQMYRGHTDVQGAYRCLGSCKDV